jgi:hypothetical protein
MAGVSGRRFAVVVLTSFLVAGCEFLDPVRPTPHADTEIFGNLMETVRDPARSGVLIAKIQVGVPRAMGRSDLGHPTPEVMGGILAVVSVSSETEVIVADRPGLLEEINPGTELVAIPVTGSTSMLGEREIRLEAAQLMDFSTYARWRLPRLDLPDNAPGLVDDPGLINSSGVEHGPVPVGDGRVLYFSARLRPLVKPEGEWAGARRAGIQAPGENQRTFERSYRTELGTDGWSPPEPVVLPGTDGATQVQVTWVSSDETRCLVTIRESGGEPWVGVSQRPGPGDAWGTVARLDGTGSGDGFDAVTMVGGGGTIVFATTRNGGSDLFLHDPATPAAQPLQPEINSAGLEWNPRVGPSNELYFVRDGRQLLFKGGRVNELRIPGPHRVVFIEGAPTADGEWLFVSVPRYRPLDIDLDIQVARLKDDGSLGSPIPVDDWRPN